MPKFFWYDHISYSDNMSYFLYKPKAHNYNRPRPLIIWLHGSGEVAVDKKSFLNEGLPYILNNWSLKPFNAYVLCPQLTIEDDIWAKDESINTLMEIIEKVIEENNRK